MKVGFRCIALTWRQLLLLFLTFKVIRWCKCIGPAPFKGGTTGETNAFNTFWKCALVFKLHHSGYFRFCFGRTEPDVTMTTTHVIPVGLLRSEGRSSFWISSFSSPTVCSLAAIFSTLRQEPESFGGGTNQPWTISYWSRGLVHRQQWWFTPELCQMSLIKPAASVYNPPLKSVYTAQFRHSRRQISSSGA